VTRGRIPKNPVMLQRPGRVSTRATLPAGGSGRRAPPLPKHHDWHPMTRRWWRNVWRSPMAAEFLEADVDQLYILAELVNRFWEAPSTKLASEIRHHSAAFGLQSVSRRRLQWTIEPAESDVGRRPPPASQDDDPRERLRPVK